MKFPDTPLALKIFFPSHFVTCGNPDEQQAMLLHMRAHFLPTIKWFTAAGLFKNYNQKLFWIKGARLGYQETVQ